VGSMEGPVTKLNSTTCSKTICILHNNIMQAAQHYAKAQSDGGQTHDAEVEHELKTELRSESPGLLYHGASPPPKLDFLRAVGALACIARAPVRPKRTGPNVHSREFALVSAPPRNQYNRSSTRAQMPHAILPGARRGIL
jgi:hypothetical protein